MTTTTRLNRRWRIGARVPFHVSAVLALLPGLAGCSYLETMTQRAGTPDPRIELGWQERRMLNPRELSDYTCPARYTLTCDRGGAITYSCTCAPK